MPLTTFSSVLTLSSARTADHLAAGIDRFVGLEHIEPKNLPIRRWGSVLFYESVLLNPLGDNS